jgi:hypothetical protein
MLKLPKALPPVYTRHVNNGALSGPNLRGRDQYDPIEAFTKQKLNPQILLRHLFLSNHEVCISCYIK